MEESKVLIGIDLSTASKELIELLIEEATEPSIFDELVRANMRRPDILMLLLEHSDTPENIKKEISKTLRIPVKTKIEEVKEKKTPEQRTQSILQRIQKLNVSERIHLALRGNKEVRTILLRDTNKEVILTVLENPKITETEIEIIAKSRSIPDEILRKITKKREWMKNYAILLSVVTNPKTPAGIAVPLVSELKTRDIAIIVNNRNISEGVRVTAKKLLRARKG
jgi:hypothetical protein